MICRCIVCTLEPGVSEVDDGGPRGRLVNCYGVDAGGQVCEYGNEGEVGYLDRSCQCWGLVLFDYLSEGEHGRYTM